MDSPHHQAFADTVIRAGISNLSKIALHKVNTKNNTYGSAHYNIEVALLLIQLLHHYQAQG